MIFFVGVSTAFSIAGFSALATRAAGTSQHRQQQTLLSRYINLIGLAVSLAATLALPNPFAGIAIGILIAALCVCAVTDLQHGG